MLRLCLLREQWPLSWYNEKAPRRHSVFPSWSWAACSGATCRFHRSQIGSTQKPAFRAWLARDRNSDPSQQQLISIDEFATSHGDLRAYSVETRFLVLEVNLQAVSLRKIDKPSENVTQIPVAYGPRPGFYIIMRAPGKAETALLHWLNPDDVHLNGNTVGKTQTFAFQVSAIKDGLWHVRDRFFIVIALQEDGTYQRIGSFWLESLDRNVWILGTNDGNFLSAYSRSARANIIVKAWMKSMEKEKSGWHSGQGAPDSNGRCERTLKH